jgi:dTDP-4-dehydrorhamnose 3,5-epimerase
VIFTPTRLKGAYLIDLELRQDARGFFARSFCEREFAEHGLIVNYPQCNVSYNKELLTLRGLHFNRTPHEEAKLVRCQAGSIYDVIVDLRPGSRTLGQWIGVELTAQNRRMIYIPKGFAHGFLTLTPDAEIFYQMSEFYVPDAGLGVRYDDPGINIQWPELPRVISERDRNYPDWHPEGEDD